MREFLEFMLSNVEIYDLSIPLLWVISGALLAVAAALRAWSSLGVVALLASLSYLAPFVKP